MGCRIAQGSKEHPSSALEHAMQLCIEVADAFVGRRGSVFNEAAGEEVALPKEQRRVRIELVAGGQVQFCTDIAAAREPAP